HQGSTDTRANQNPPRRRQTLKKPSKEGVIGVVVRHYKEDQDDKWQRCCSHAANAIRWPSIFDDKEDCSTYINEHSDDGCWVQKVCKYPANYSTNHTHSLPL